MTLAEQLACVEREIRFREDLNPRWCNQIDRDRIADLACMRAVAETLRGLMKGEGS